MAAVLEEAVGRARRAVDLWDNARRASDEMGGLDESGLELLAQARDQIVSLEPLIAEFRAVDRIAEHRRTLLARPKRAGRPRKTE
jgi:hypothetical protein